MIQRRKTYQVQIGGNSSYELAEPITIGSNAPVAVQSMTNTDTADIDATVKQIADLATAGSELVRITVNNEEAAQAVPEIAKKLQQNNVKTHLVGDFHYNGHRLLQDFPEMAQALAKYRINPGNVGFGNKKDTQFSQIIECAIKYNKPVRIGVNWGSLDQSVLAKLLDENASLDTDKQKSLEELQIDALIESALSSAKLAEDIGLPSDKIIISCKLSQVQNLITAYRKLAAQCKYPLHLGLTEAGMGSKGIVASTAALSVLLQEGIGDTIRISLTPKPGEARTTEVKVAQEILQTMGLRSFCPMVTACPGCGRTTSTAFQELAETVESHIKNNIQDWKNSGYKGVEDMDIAVMGCIVNGPGESKHANIGISLPGSGESPSMPVFEDGKKVATLKGDDISTQFLERIDNYVMRKYG